MTEPDRHDPLLPEHARQMSGWTRRYLQSRSIGVLIALLIFIVVWFFGMGANLLLGWAIYKHRPLLVGMGAVAEACWLAAVVYISVPRWGGRLITRWAARFYQREGSAEFAGPAGGRRSQWVVYVVAGLFGLCVLTTVVLGGCGSLPDLGRYMQPLSAAYMVPFLVFLWWWQRPRVSPVALVWPILYALHAVLIIVGAPIVFGGRYEAFNMYLPVFGYGILTTVMGHLYNRLALRRLQQAARQGLS
jgi:hypothetical protein